MLLGNFNSQYENYYNSLGKRSKADYSSFYKENKFLNVKGNTCKKNSFIFKRLIVDLSGVLVLFILIMSCKIIVTPKTQAVYNYSKDVVNRNYDYKELADKSKNIDFKKVQDKVTKIIDNVRSKITGNETVIENIKNNFILPVGGVETSSFGFREDPVKKNKAFHEGIDIDVKENTEVKASYSGKIKNCGFDKELGNYILIDHGKGIETKYGHLNKILVNKEDAVKKSQIIAKSGNTGKSTGPHLHFELLYMGENQNPEDYFIVSKNNY